MGLTDFAKAILFILLLLPFYLASEESISINQEISRLERISQGQNTQERYQAYMSLARLHSLRGNSEAALVSYGNALLVSPNDGQALFEQGRILISMGEYEQASFSFNALLAGNRDAELLIQGRYYAAMLDAFRSGNLRPLIALADDIAFREYHSQIIYTLWKLSDDRVWANRLTRDFPNSPEAKIINFTAVLAATPQWIFFPGRNSLSFASPQSPAAIDNANLVFLQIGLFAREANAEAAAERLRHAGFEPIIMRRNVYNAEQWAAGINTQSINVNNALRQLRDAGFDAFPVR